MVEQSPLKRTVTGPNPVRPTSMYTTYVVKNDGGKIYIGQTDDLNTRLRLHNEKAFKKCYTSRFDGRWDLIYQEQVSTRQEVLKREKQLKSYRGRKFIKTLIP